MKEVAKVVLDKELDLIQAYKRTMKLAELAGLPLADQTSFATAVSEIAQDVMAHRHAMTLTLGLSEEKERHLLARIQVKNYRLNGSSQTGIQYARQLVTHLALAESECGSEITLQFRLPAQDRLSDVTLQEWEGHLRDEPVLSPIEQIRQHNRQVQQLAEQLRESENQYQTLTNSLPLMIFTATNEGQFLYTNKWLLDYTGTTLDVLNDRGWRSVVHADDAYKNWHWREHLPAQTNFQNEIRIRNAATGEYIWHLINATAILNDEKQVISWNGFLVNIHAQKMMDRTLKDNQELTETKQQLEQYQLELQMNIGELNRSNQELAEFAYVASHDLQEPLRKIQSFGTLLLEQASSELNSSAKDMIHRMHSAAERMHVLIKDLLSYSRLNTHQQTFRPVDLNDLVNEVMVDLELNIRERNAQIKCQSLPTIKGNPLQLRQMFQNLLSNALKFRSPERPPQIRVRTEKVTIFDIPVPMRKREPAYLAISVEDNGIGFDERYHDRIFQLFQRLHSRDQYAGTGIGLTICKKVAEMHGGTIAAQSTPGEGATFTVYLPVSVLVKTAVVGTEL
ncbi:ATP-binding protein [Larkinella insperata]|uniref:histidine kinase n=1 Tax=Larkinella insperata TaxID=332158 RepID=A0ABW3QEV2_9BACT|nr:ATP-binding protein [Larkinella insperata]